MTTDLVRTVASVFRRKGALDLTTAEFKHALSLDLRWFAPADARKLLAHAVNNGIVEEQGDRVAARFDVERVDVPFSFRPSLDVLDEPPPAKPLPPRPAARAPPPPERGEAPPPVPAPAPVPDRASVAREALAAAARASGLDVETIEREAAEERARRGGLFSADVAALVAARRRGVDVRAMAGRLSRLLPPD